MKTIIFIIIISIPLITIGQKGDLNLTSDQVNKEQKFEVSILKANKANGKKMGASITNHNEKYQYTFQWTVDGKPAGNTPLIRITTGKQIELKVTRYPGADQAITSLNTQLSKPLLPLYPQKNKIDGMIAANE